MHLKPSPQRREAENCMTLFIVVVHPDRCAESAKSPAMDHSDPKSGCHQSELVGIGLVELAGVLN